MRDLKLAWQRHLMQDRGILCGDGGMENLRSLFSFAEYNIVITLKSSIFRTKKKII
jgi:hypothetical protein